MSGNECHRIYSHKNNANYVGGLPPHNNDSSKLTKRSTFCFAYCPPHIATTIVRQRDHHHNTPFGAVYTNLIHGGGLHRINLCSHKKSALEVKTLSFKLIISVEHSARLTTTTLPYTDFNAIPVIIASNAAMLVTGELTGFCGGGKETGRRPGGKK